MNPNINLQDIINIINKIKNEIKNGLMNSLLDNIYENNNKNDLLVKYNNITYQLTTSYNHNSKIYNNAASIDLGECENILKEKYKLNQNKSLIIFIISYFIEGLNIPIIRFEVFDPISKEQLNINFCENTNINIYTPVSINEENLFKYNPNNDYYNDICFRYTTDKGTDIVLVDRRKEYNMNNISLCEINCIFKKYDLKTKKVQCECNINNRTFLNLEDLINKKKLLNNFVDIKSTSNLLVMKCYNLLFKKEIFFKNIGNYILLSIIIIYIFGIILFYIKEYPLIIIKIINIIENKKNKKENEENQNKEIFHKDDIKQNPIKKKKNVNEPEENSSNSYLKKDNNMFQVRVDTVNYRDCEINNFSYKEAVKKDKRQIFEYFISLIKTKHILIFNFFPNFVHTPIIIKICLILFIFALYYTINTLFFNDSTMHKIYEDEGIFNFIYLLPNIIYSTIISSIITIIIKKLALLDNIIYELKKKSDIKEYEIKKQIKIKFLCFFLFSFIFLIFFWYYVSCFCAVYTNTQLLLIKDTLISFGINLLYPFIFFLIASIIRILSVKKSEKLLEFCYKFSKLI